MCRDMKFELEFLSLPRELWHGTAHKVHCGHVWCLGAGHEVGILHLLMKNVLDVHSGGLGIVVLQADRGSHLFHLSCDIQFPRLFQRRRVQFPLCLGRWFGPT